MTSFYRPLLWRVLGILRRNLILWPLAFFTSFLGIAGTFQVFFDLSVDASGDRAITNFFNQTDFITATFANWNQAWSAIQWSALDMGDLPYLAIFLLTFILILVAAVFITSSEGGLLYALGALLGGKKTTYLESFRRGLDKFWPLFVINVAYGMLYLIVIHAIILPVIYLLIVPARAPALLTLILVYLIIIPSVITIELIKRYTMLYLVLYDKNIWDSVKRSLLLFRTNWIVSVETAGLLLLVFMIFFAIMGIIIVPFLLLLFALFATLVAFSPTAFQLVSLFSLFASIAVIASYVSAFTIFQFGVWVGVFKKITSGEHPSKIHRLLAHLPWLHKPII